MEKLEKVIEALEYCNTHEGDVCPDCPGFHDDPVPCSIAGDRLVLGYLKELRDLKIAVTAAGVLERYRPAFEELAKGEE